MKSSSVCAASVLWPSSVSSSSPEPPSAPAFRSPTSYANFRCECAGTSASSTYQPCSGRHSSASASWAPLFCVGNPDLRGHPVLRRQPCLEAIVPRRQPCSSRRRYSGHPPHRLPHRSRRPRRPPGPQQATAISVARARARRQSCSGRHCSTYQPCRDRCCFVSALYHNCIVSRIGIVSGLFHVSALYQPCRDRCCSGMPCSGAGAGAAAPI